MKTLLADHKNPAEQENSLFASPLLRAYKKLNISNPMTTTVRMTQLYMILSAVGSERGQPIGLYFDPFKAQADYNAINDIGSALTGNLTAFLVAYEMQKGGELVELQELGRK